MEELVGTSARQPTLPGERQDRADSGSPGVTGKLSGDG